MKNPVDQQYLQYSEPAHLAPTTMLCSKSLKSPFFPILMLSSASTCLMPAIQSVRFSILKDHYKLYNMNIVKWGTTCTMHDLCTM